MKLFESDNIWKRRERSRQQAARPDTPENRLADARNKLTGDALWTAGAAILVALGLVGLRLGVVEPGVVTVVFLVVLALYVLISLPGLKKDREEYRACKEQAEKK